jgi:hypothetical protein
MTWSEQIQKCMSMNINNNMRRSGWCRVAGLLMVRCKFEVMEMEELMISMMYAAE